MNLATSVVSLVAAVTMPLSTHVVPVQQVTVEQKFTFAFVGDIHFEGALSRYAKSGGLDALRSLYADSDFVMANLETAVTNRGVAERKTYRFRARPTAVDALESARITVVTMANNHALDYGRTVVGDSLDAFANRSVGLVGIGRNQDQALTPFRTEIGEPGHQLSVSVFGVASREMLGEGLLQRWSATPTRGGIVTWDYHRQALVQAIEMERAAGRFVIVYVHWGQELNPCPTAIQRSILNSLDQAGASLVVGTHPHILQPAGFTDSGMPVIFSTGNFVWYHSRGGPTAVVKVRIVDGKAEAIETTPAIIRAGLPRFSAKSSGTIERKLFGASCSPLHNSP